MATQNCPNPGECPTHIPDSAYFIINPLSSFLNIFLIVFQDFFKTRQPFSSESMAVSCSTSSRKHRRTVQSRGKNCDSFRSISSTVISQLTRDREEETHPDILATRVNVLYICPMEVTLIAFISGWEFMYWIAPIFLTFATPTMIFH